MGTGGETEGPVKIGDFFPERKEPFLLLLPLLEMRGLRLFIELSEPLGLVVVYDLREGGEGGEYGNEIVLVYVMAGREIWNVLEYLLAFEGAVHQYVVL